MMNWTNLDFTDLAHLLWILKSYLIRPLRATWEAGSSDKMGKFNTVVLYDSYFSLALHYANPPPPPLKKDEH